MEAPCIPAWPETVLPVSPESRILLLEDVEQDALLIERDLRVNGINAELRIVSNREDFERALADFQPGLILSDYQLPGYSGMDALKTARHLAPDAPFIIVTGALGEEIAVETIKNGATDYILKDRLYKLASAVRRALREVAERRQHRLVADSLRLAEARKGAILEATLDGVVTIDANGKILEFNAAAERMFGITRQRVLGALIAEGVIPLSLRTWFERGLHSQFTSDTGPTLGARLEMAARRADGTDFPAEFTIVRIQSAGPPLFTAFIRDLRERKRAEAQLAVFARLGHQLNAPVTYQQVATLLVDVAGQLFGWRRAGVYINRQGEDLQPILRLASANATVAESTPIEADLDLPWRDLLHEALARGKLAAGPPFSLPNSKTAHGALMAVPLRTGGRGIGVVCLEAPASRFYSQRDLQVLQSLVDRCADALHRVSAAEALREAEAKYRSIFENVTEGIFQTTPGGKYLSANPALARMFGYDSPADLVSSVVNIEAQTYVDPTRRAELKRELEGQGFIQNFEAERYRKDRQRIWVSINARAVRHPSGEILYYEGTNQEITARKSAERVLRESEERFRTLFELAPIGIALHDAQGHFIHLNRAYCEMLGYQAEDICRLGVKGITHPDDISEGQKYYHQFVEGVLHHYHREKRYLHKSGRVVWAQSYSSAIRDSAGSLQFIISMVEDISPRKELEKEILEISANERRRIGHDLHDGLGQYLAGIAFRAKALEHHLAGQNLSWAKDAHELTIFLSKAISQTRSLAKGLDPVEVEAHGALTAALQNLAAHTEEMFGASCKFIGPESPGLESLGPQVAVPLYRIAQEAIHNAISHGEAKNIKISLTVAENELRLEIEDDGCGFDPAHLVRPGMGLRVMQYRASLMGGQVVISSEPGSGTSILCRVVLSSPLP